MWFARHSAAMLSKPTHSEQLSGTDLWSQPEKEPLPSRGCCVRQVLNKETLCALPTGMRRGFILESQRSFAGGRSSNSVVALSEF